MKTVVGERIVFEAEEHAPSFAGRKRHLGQPMREG